MIPALMSLCSARTTRLNRLKVYHDQTAPLVDFYQKKGLLRVIDGDQDMDTIFASIMAIVKG